MTIVQKSKKVRTLSAGPYPEMLKHIMLQNENAGLQHIAIFKQDRTFCLWVSEVHDILYLTSDKNYSDRGTPISWYMNPPGSYRDKLTAEIVADKWPHSLY